ncbi:type II secretion system protein GspE [Alginatibacterium sediminis]|uniref:Type II secretion system protein E n=1 Tax=Alginatibacterium sediminis TaxID=2164068 RepID=A0A420E6A8_9ALTE|nr:type II secretion system ATPase GspE [Alginatibacterium sediminis]RKF13197.1 type II secretion system protein GspE [Alginatibacterium sediminis]
MSHLPVEQSQQSKDLDWQLPYSYAKAHGVYLHRENSQLELCYCQQPSLDVLLEVSRFVDEDFLHIEQDQQGFENGLTQCYQRDSSQARELMQNIGNEMDFFTLAEELPNNEDLLDSDDDAPIIKLINAMLGEAIKEGASDIHVETYERQLVIRFRIDGVLREILRPQRRLASLLVSRIKVMARLDIAEKRLPQDGRISLRIAGRNVDVRVSTMPTAHGERVVLRLLDQNQARLSLGNLGLQTHSQQNLHDILYKPHGIVLVTGPTGSGKSTTLYAGLSEINGSQRNILTVEDPIEYNIEGIGQTQVNTKVDMTFARGLRAILRQDPDVVMIGEIRDLETAQIAVQASLTGHLVLSTLHTNTAIGAITRMRDMGIEPFLLASSLLGVLAQRLIRCLCRQCRQPHMASEQEMALLGIKESLEIYSPRGCEQCNGTGYRGRVGIYELLQVNDRVRDLIHSDASEHQFIQALGDEHLSIRQDGISKVLSGVSTLEEVLRVTREE